MVKMYEAANNYHNTIALICLAVSFDSLQATKVPTSDDFMGLEKGCPMFFKLSTNKNSVPIYVKCEVRNEYYGMYAVAVVHAAAEHSLQRWQHYTINISAIKKKYFILARLKTRKVA